MMRLFREDTSAAEKEATGRIRRRVSGTRGFGQAGVLGSWEIGERHRSDGKLRGEEMSVSDQIQADIKTAMKERDKARLGTLRMVGAALKNASLETGEPISEGDETAILRRQLKQREESAEAFRKAGREESANAEAAEAEIIRGYLPQSLSEDEMSAIVDRAVSETGVEGMKDMGRAMGRASELSEGRADGKELSALVRSRLQ